MGTWTFIYLFIEFFKHPYNEFQMKNINKCSGLIRINPIQPDVSDHGRDLTGGKSYPPYKFSIKTVQMTIKFML